VREEPLSLALSLKGEGTLLCRMAITVFFLRLSGMRQS